MSDWRDILLSPNGVRAILFDLDGTLRYNRPSSVQVFYDQAAHLGVEDSPQNRRQATRWWHYYWAQSTELMEDLKVYVDKEEAFWINYSRRHLVALGCPPDLALELAPQMHRYMSSEYQPEDWVPPEVPATLQALQAAGFRLAVLSNRTSPCTDYLGTLGLEGFFDQALVAGELACWKPDPEIFRLALQRCGAQPEETLYVGDNYYADVVGARRAGLRPVLIDPEGLFPEAGCEVIHSLGDLPQILESKVEN
jgi:HAD superfamily hydrolase (TIGR01549 family)